MNMHKYNTTKGVFVERRQILDVVLVANEVVDAKGHLGDKVWFSILMLRN